MTPEQRKKFWAMVGDVASQVQMVMSDGSLVWADRESWRFVFAAGLVGEQRIAVGIHGEHVVLGMRLRDIFAGLDEDDAKRRASDLIELVAAFGASHAVSWSDPQWVAAQREYEVVP